ncbi:MAG: hypothetical protein MUE47_08815, partial [Acidobacteria bacterium]|nr:hypothetical protein [Acidobacteriota bacterium]
REGRARPGDLLLLEIWGACSLVRRDLPQAEPTALEHDLRVLALAEARAEESIRRAIEQEGADREAARRLLVWRRYLAELTDRVRTRLAPPKPATPPAAAAAPAPAAPAPTAAAPSTPAAAGSGNAAAGQNAQGMLFRATTKLMGLLKR